MTYSIIIQLIVSGLALGFIYALVAIEYTLIFYWSVKFQP